MFSRELNVGKLDMDTLLDTALERCCNVASCENLIYKDGLCEEHYAKIIVKRDNPSRRNYNVAPLNHKKSKFVNEPDFELHKCKTDGCNQVSYSGEYCAKCKMVRDRDRLNKLKRKVI